MDDAMESLDDEDIEAEADSEVEKVLWELTEGKLGEAPNAVKDSLKQPADKAAIGAKAVKGQAQALADPDFDEAASDEEMETMRTRLEHLKS